MRDLGFLRIEEHPFLISLVTSCSHRDNATQEETPHLWAWAQADLASSGTGGARWPGSPFVALSLAAVCLHHLEDKF